MSPPAYSPRLALRHLWRGPFEPLVATREALAVGLSELWRLLLFALAVLCLWFSEPETRSMTQAWVANAFDDASRLAGLMLLAIMTVMFVVVFYAGYWAVSLVVYGLSRVAGEAIGLSTTRSIVVMATWIALLPTLLVKSAALFALPKAMIVTDPPSLYSAIEGGIAVPYLTAALMAGAGLSMLRAVGVAAFVNAAFYLLFFLLAVIWPSQ